MEVYLAKRKGKCKSETGLCSLLEVFIFRANIFSTQDPTHSLLNAVI